MIILITVWGLRLSAHIFMRSCGKPEDIRYAKLIEIVAFEPRFANLYKNFFGARFFHVSHCCSDYAYST